jgi:hypothetical protein
MINCIRSSTSLCFTTPAATSSSHFARLQCNVFSSLKKEKKKIIYVGRGKPLLVILFIVKNVIIDVLSDRIK